MTLNFTVASQAELDAAVREIDIGGASAADGASYTITLTARIELGGDPLAVNLADGAGLTIVGEQTLDGNGIARGLFVEPAPCWWDLTIAETVAQGGDGAAGGGGGAGLGGEMFIGDHGAVTLAGVAFSGNQAIGGDGATAGPDGLNGGGGGMGGNGAAGVGSVGGGGGGLGRGADGGSPGQPGQPGILPGTVGQAGINTTRPTASTVGGGMGGADGGGGGGASTVAGGTGGTGGGYYTTRRGGYLPSNLGGGGGGGTGGFVTGGLGYQAGFVSGGFGGGGGADVLTGGGGHGGFGGGGGASTFSTGGGGFGAGNSDSVQGGGGLGAGGAIFVSQFGELTIAAGTIEGGTVAGGQGAFDGQGLGAGIFAMYRADRAVTLDPAAGATVLIASGFDDDRMRFFATTRFSTPIMVQGDGRVILAAANSTGLAGAIIDGGTLELADPDAVAPGVDPGTTIANAGYIRFEAPGSLLVIDGTSIPALTLDQFMAGQTIDLADLAPAGSAATLEAGGTLAIPTTGGTVRFHLLNTPVTPVGTTFGMISDGAGGTLISGDATLPPAVVTVRGAAGGTISFLYDNFANSQAANIVAPILSQSVDAGTVIPFEAVAGGTVPAVGAGQTLEVIDHGGGAYTLGSQDNVFVSDAAGAVSVTAGSGTVLLLTGTSDLTFNAGAGEARLYSAGGNASIDVAPGMPGITAWLGNGANTISALGGNNTFNTGTGSNLITLGIGQNRVFLSGTDTVMAGPGSSYIQAEGTAQDLIFLGSTGGTFVGSMSGVATVVGGAGINAVTDASNGTIFYAAGNSTFQGAGTVVGGSGSVLDVTLNAPSGAASPAGSMVFTGAGPVRVDNMSGAATVVGNPAGSATVNVAGGSALIFATGPTFVSSGNGGGVATVAGGDGPLEVNGGSGLFQAGALGNSHISVRGNSTVFGTAAGDVLESQASNGEPVVLVAGAGAETLSGAGGFGTNTFFGGAGPELIKAGSWLTSVVTGTGSATLVGGTGAGLALYGLVQGNAPTLLVQDFEPGKDFFTLINFGTGELASLLAGATTAAGSESFTLSDGTHVTLQGFTGLSVTDFL